MFKLGLSEPVSCAKRGVITEDNGDDKINVLVCVCVVT